MSDLASCLARYAALLSPEISAQQLQPLGTYLQTGGTPSLSPALEESLFRHWEECLQALLPWLSAQPQRVTRWARAHGLLWQIMHTLDSNPKRYYQTSLLRWVLEQAQQAQVTWGLLEFAHAHRELDIALEPALLAACLQSQPQLGSVGQHWTPGRPVTLGLSTVRYPVPLFECWPRAPLWEFLCAQQSPLNRLLLEQQGELATRVYTLQLISQWPVFPAPLLTGIASGSSASQPALRLAALQCVKQLYQRWAQVEPQTQLLALVGAGLKAPQPGVRRDAVRWLAELCTLKLDAVGERRPLSYTQQTSIARALLQQALAQEKHIAVSAALQGALVEFGLVSDNEQWLAQARQLLKRGWPKTLAWLKIEQLPALHWNDDTPVEPVLLRAWLVQALRVGNIEPDALQRHIAQQLNPSQRQALALALLERWIGEDTRLISLEDAQAAAQKRAQVHLDYAQRWPNSNYGVLYAGMNVAQVTAQLLPDYQQQVVGDASASKGLLSLVAAWGDARVVEPIRGYFKRWPKQRQGQRAALLRVLAQLERYPSALSALFVLSQHLHGAWLRYQAQGIVQALARQRGWTLDELADHSVATAGLDANGQRVLEYGARQFSLRLGSQLQLGLYDAHGKALKKLPAAAQGDDPALVKLAKQELRLAKQDITSVLATQPERWYQALCTQRCWTYRQWLLVIAQHPLLRQLAQRVLWAERLPSGEIGRSFRLLDDATLSDAQDHTVTLEADTLLVLAHASQLSPEQRLAWQAHFIDYQIQPLLEQLSLPASDLDWTSNYYVTAAALYPSAQQLGYQAQTHYERTVERYSKAFPSLDLVVNLPCSGHSVPPTAEQVLLQPLSCTQHGQAVALAQLPAVLLAECQRDWAQLAQLGKREQP